MPAQATYDAALAFTHGDHYKPVPGYQVMNHHYHMDLGQRLGAGRQPRRRHSGSRRAQGARHQHRQPDRFGGRRRRSHAGRRGVSGGARCAAAAVRRRRRPADAAPALAADAGAGGQAAAGGVAATRCRSDTTRSKARKRHSDSELPRDAEPGVLRQPARRPHRSAVLASGVLGRRAGQPDSRSSTSIRSTARSITSAAPTI